jgi:hypothetical protein
MVSGPAILANRQVILFVGRLAGGPEIRIDLDCSGSIS